MNCPRCGRQMLTASDTYTCTNPHCTVRTITRNYEVPADPMDGLECDSCQ